MRSKICKILGNAQILIRTYKRPTTNLSIKRLQHRTGEVTRVTINGTGSNPEYNGTFCQIPR